MKEKRKIVNGRIMSSIDGGVSFVDIGPASQADITAYENRNNVPLLIEPYAYKQNDKTGKPVKNASQYDKAQWRKWAEETGFKPTKRTAKEQNREFQEHLLNNPKFKDRVKQYHEELGMPYAGHPTDAYLGLRWDKILNKLTAKEPGKQPPIVDIKTQKPAAPVDNTYVAGKRYPPQVGVGQKPYAPWWLQDIIKTSGAALDLARIKKYMPWQGEPNVHLAEPTFYDPTRELAANAEQANMASQFHQAFTGPKSGAISGVQGKSLSNAADIMSKYNNLNVGIANQTSQNNANTMNQYSQNKANLATQLYDKNIMANQNFDTSKNMGRQNLRQSYIDSITNRGKTQALNTLYPNYYTDPSRGGMVSYNPGYGPIPPNMPNNKDDYYEALKITRDPDRALRYLEMQRSGKIQSPYTAKGQYLNQQGYNRRSSQDPNADTE